MYLRRSLLAITTFVGLVTGATCPGYTAQNITQSSTGLTAYLKLAGPACNVYGDDLDDLVLNVEYQTSKQKYSPSVVRYH